MQHPTTCQCGGKGSLPKECTCNCKPCGCTFYECPGTFCKCINEFGYPACTDHEPECQITPLKTTQEMDVDRALLLIEDWIGGNVDDEGKYDAMALTVYLRSILDTLLTSQALQERHEGEIKALREAIIHACEANGAAKECLYAQKCWSDGHTTRLPTCIACDKNRILYEFDHTAQLNKKGSV